MASDLDVLLTAIDRDLPPGTWKPWPGGWPGEIEAALIDAVLSIRASYGSQSNGVRGAVTRYRAARGGESLDDLTMLAAYDDAELRDVLDNRQLTSGTPKASAIAAAARALVQAGVRHATDLVAGSQAHRAAYCSVHGLGWITWNYFTMLLGHPGVKADTWVVRYVTEAVRHPVTPEESADLVTGAAGKLGVSPTDLDHAIWDFMRRRPKP